MFTFARNGIIYAKPPLQQTSMNLFSKGKTIVLFLFLTCIFYLSAQNKVSLYTSNFINAYNRIQYDTAAVTQLQRRYGVQQYQQTSYINAFIEFDGVVPYKALAEYDVQLNALVENMATARIPVDNLEAVSLLEHVQYVELGLPVSKLMDNARVVTQADKVMAGTGLETAYKGKDVLVGIVDGGFQYGHADFYDPQTGELRIKRVWNQNKTRQNTPQGYDYGAEYQTSDEILAAAYDSWTETHGTHVAGIAAGSDVNNENPYYGIASQADLVLVSYDVNDNANNTHIADGVKYIYDYAASVGKPCVVNLSLGMHVGPHDGTSFFDRFCDQLQGPGRLLVGAAGNENEAAIHLSKSFTGPDNELNTFLAFEDNPNGPYAVVDVWGEENEKFSLQVFVYDAAYREVFASDKVTIGGAGSYEYELREDKDGATGVFYIGMEKKAQANNRPHILFIADMSQINRGYKIGLKISGSSGTLHAWSYGAQFNSHDRLGFSNGNGENSVGEIGGTGKRIISVGAFTSKSVFKNIYNDVRGYGQYENEITTFSSCGPTLDGRMKPDVTAPGSAIVSSFSDQMLSQMDYYFSFVMKSSFSGHDYYYGAMQGTSMAAPFVAGVLATWLEAKNDLTPEEAKYILKLTSMKDKYTGDASGIDKNTWGYGKINAWEGIKRCIDLARQQENINTEQGMFLYQTAGEVILQLYDYETEEVNLAFFNTNGQRVATRKVSVGDITQPVVIDVDGLPRGLYVVKIEGNKLKYPPHRIVLY